MSVRRATETDLPRLIELMAQLHPDEPETEDPSRVEDYARVLARMTAQGQRVLVAEDDGRIAGALVLVIVENITRKGTPYAIIENMVVDEASRGQRYGEALIEQAILEARRAGCYKVSLTSNKRRAEAHRFYERLGFVQTHEAFRIDL
ncbi:MAG: GNAT family N-acetyltransferase [Chloroflexi bacterium]|nr:GNAT family N-acetyltransferase [Chloroflexota bacterium]